MNAIEQCVWALETIEQDCIAWIDGTLNASAEGEFHKFANKARAAIDGIKKEEKK